MDLIVGPFSHFQYPFTKYLLMWIQILIATLYFMIIISQIFQALQDLFKNKHGKTHKK